jgi:UDP-3-O-[3-hydroxymyristoyl] glucosamine N-acyltransferase
MADKRFFTVAGPFTLGQIAELTGSELSDPVAATRVIVDVAPLQEAGSDNLAFLDNKKYIGAFKTTKAAACFVRPEFAQHAPAGTVCLTHKNPYKAYALAAQAFYPAVTAVEYRAPSASIDPSARIGRDVHVGPGAVIERDALIGDRCRIGPNAVIGAGVEIGADGVIGSNVSLSHSILGARVHIQPGCVIGSPGFGFAIDPAGYVTVPQLGRVIIGDDVDIGANVTIDRGAGPDTVIGAGTRLDNLVHFAHNVKIGRGCIIAGQVGVSGSTEIGDYVMVGGQAGFVGHLKVGSGAKIAAQSGIMQDVAPGAELMGYPGVPLKQFLRQSVLLSRMSDKKKSEEK